MVKQEVSGQCGLPIMCSNRVRANQVKDEGYKMTGIHKLLSLHLEIDVWNLVTITVKYLIV